MQRRQFINASCRGSWAVSHMVSIAVVAGTIERGASSRLWRCIIRDRRSFRLVHLRLRRCVHQRDPDLRRRERPEQVAIATC